MVSRNTFCQSGIAAALGAAVLFGAGTPLAKWLLDSISPWMMAGLLYFGAGLGLTLYRQFISAPAVRLPRSEIPWLAGAILTGRAEDTGHVGAAPGAVKVVEEVDPLTHGGVDVSE